MTPSAVPFAFGKPSFSPPAAPWGASSGFSDRPGAGTTPGGVGGGLLPEARWDTTGREDPGSATADDASADGEDALSRASSSHTASDDGPLPHCVPSTGENSRISESDDIETMYTRLEDGLIARVSPVVRDAVHRSVSEVEDRLVALFNEKLDCFDREVSRRDGHLATLTESLRESDRAVADAQKRVSALTAELEQTKAELQDRSWRERERTVSVDRSLKPRTPKTPKTDKSSDEAREKRRHQRGTKATPSGSSKPRDKGSSSSSKLGGLFG